MLNTVLLNSDMMFFVEFVLYLFAWNFTRNYLHKYVDILSFAFVYL